MTGGRSKSGDASVDEDDDNKAGGMKKKILKKGLKQNLKNQDKPRSANGKTAKRPPKWDAKRERDEQDDDDDDGTPLRKRMKLQRVGSTASLQTSIAGEESIDGSFVDGDDSGNDE